MEANLEIELSRYRSARIKDGDKNSAIIIVGITNLCQGDNVELELLSSEEIALKLNGVTVDNLSLPRPVKNEFETILKDEKNGMVQIKLFKEVRESWKGLLKAGCN